MKKENKIEKKGQRERNRENENEILWTIRFRWLS